MSRAALQDVDRVLGCSHETARNPNVVAKIEFKCQKLGCQWRALVDLTASVRVSTPNHHSLGRAAEAISEMESELHRLLDGWPAPQDTLAN